MSKVTNTSKDGVNPHWVMGGNPGAIEAQEAAGQSELVASTQLPVKVSPELKAELEKAGVVFGEPDPNDPIFCDATLPLGWRKEATDHDMWSKLLDDKGVERASIFYKAAFYDRSAALHKVG